MANIKTELSGKNNIKVTFKSKRTKHLRQAKGWLDWMLKINDFRDMIIPLSQKDIDYIITKLLNGHNKMSFICNGNKQEYKISRYKKIVRRLDAGYERHEYLSVALFVKVSKIKWPPAPVEIKRNEIIMLMKAMITLDRPVNHYITDSVRNYQYLLAVLWLKKKNPYLLKGEKKPSEKEIFRISLTG
jgi:hypothetical protein